MAESDPADVRAILTFIRDHPGVPYYEVEREFHHIYGRIPTVLGYLCEMKFIAYHVGPVNDADKGIINVLRLYPR